MSRRTKLIVNFIGFELGWFACVLGGAHHLLWLGPLVVALFILWHLREADPVAAELRLLLMGTVLGSLFDQSLLAAGWLAYPESGWPNWLLPPWMIALWLGFCGTLNVSMRWLRAYPSIAFLLGLVGGPLAYWGGVKLGAMVWLQPTNMLIALALGWGVMMPLLFRISTRFDGFTKGTR